MTDLSALGLVSFGIVLTLAVLGGFVLWVTRGFRVDLSGIRLVRTDTWSDRVLESLRRAQVDDEPAPMCLQKMPGMSHHVCHRPLGHVGRHETGEGAYWSSNIDWASVQVDGDSERPPAVQHGARTREVDGG